MKIGIDASNIRTGGGKNHLVNFINHSLEYDKNISFVVISNHSILSSIKLNKRITTHTNFLLNSINLFAFISQLLFSYRYFKVNNCDLVFVPGGIFISKFRPYITMSQNMIPFDDQTIKKFGLLSRIKFKLVKWFQIKTFKRSKGVIFLNNYVKNKITRNGLGKLNYKIIPHGIIHQKKNYYTFSNKPFKILYVSDFLPYKHNINVVQAVSELILEGQNIDLTLIGKKDKYQFSLINKLISSNKVLMKKIKVLGGLSNDIVLKHYKDASLFLFASTCENQPIIILEALSFGLPIISSNRGPMKYMISGDNVLFDSYKTNDIKRVIQKNMSSTKLTKLSKSNYLLSKNYNWKKNVSETIAFFKSQL